MSLKIGIDRKDSMTKIRIEDIRRDPDDFLRRIEAGEALTILEAGRPIAEVRPIAPSPKHPRPFGLCAGEFTEPDDFDGPLPDDILYPVAVVSPT